MYFPMLQSVELFSVEQGKDIQHDSLLVHTEKVSILSAGVTVYYINLSHQVCFSQLIS
jgi:hypothetical protein